MEVQHIATFFQANGYYQLKTNEFITKPNSREFKDLDVLEVEGYEKAKEIRQEILKDVSDCFIVPHLALVDVLSLVYEHRRERLLICC